MDNLVISAAIAFLAKILQAKFRLTPGRAALLYGCSSLPAAILGNIVGETKELQFVPPFP